MGLFDKLTGRDQKKKVRDRTQWAQNAYNEAGRLKNEYSSNIEPHIKNIEHGLVSAIRTRNERNFKIDALQHNASYLDNNIRNQESRLGDIGRDLNSNVAQYESGLNQHKEDVAKFHEEGASLQSLVDVFKKEAPELSNSIEEYQKLPQDFLNRFEEQKAKRATLEGFSKEEMGEDKFNEFESGVESLKDKRSELEKIITEKYQGLSKQHQELAGKHQNITSLLKGYKTKQDELLGREDIYNRKKTELEHIISGYKIEENKYNQEINKKKQLKSDYDLQIRMQTDNKSKIDQLLKDAIHYEGMTKNYQNSIDHQISEGDKFAGWAQGHAKKANQIGKNWMIGGAILGGLTMGIGALGGIGGMSAMASYGVLGSAIATSSTLTSIGIGAGIGGLAGGLISGQFGGKKTPTLNMPDSHIDTDKYRNFQNAIHGDINDATYLGKDAPISSGMLGNKPKVNIPELGGWQSPQHFGVKQMPAPHEIPTLETALGRLKDPKELNSLTLGLPKLSGRDGKQYNFAVLYDPMYMDKFKNVMKKAQRYGGNLLNNNSQVYA